MPERAVHGCRTTSERRNLILALGHQARSPMRGRTPRHVQSSPSSTGPQEPATADLSGRCVGNSYILIAPVGQGATGTVWRAIERNSGTYVAVKLLHESLLRQPKLVT